MSKTLLVVLVVLALVVLLAPAWAADGTPLDLQPLTLVVAHAPPPALALDALTLVALHETAAARAGPIIIPDEQWEFSVLGGTSFSAGVLAGAVSYKALQTASGKASFWADLGLQVDGGRTSPILGGSTNLPTGDTKLRAGAGVRFLEWRWSGADFILYSRLAF